MCNNDDGVQVEQSMSERRDTNDTAQLTQAKQRFETKVPLTCVCMIVLASHCCRV